MFIDIDSTICEVHGDAKQGAAYGYTRQLGLHPLLAARADTGELLHARMRKGSAGTARGAERFVRETIGRVRRAGATGQLIFRLDSGFWSKAVMKACTDHDAEFSITDPPDPRDRGPYRAQSTNPHGLTSTTPPAGSLRSPNRSRWTSADRAPHPHHRRPQTMRLFPDWRHHAFITNRTGDAVVLDRDHRAHAVVELAIRDLKHGAGLNHCPSGAFKPTASGCSPPPWPTTCCAGSPLSASKHPG